MGLSVWEILILLLIAAILFGAGKLPQVMGDLGKSVRAFKAGWSEDDAPGTAADNTARGVAAPPPEGGRRSGTEA
ncbi:sec-independent protein translocase protein TatA [Azospirillum sp. OGB3]|uniref:twin-arginine translocase TatA/TatE family subunit n=1 Tax=Azospirillum sp. OGB3 TaxID=2587012 RepID=UPI0016062F9A|nr:twin-arginine translocase TatA/TatE family subunit [Azospirillum sp. OGB3]MBB3268500.1 sec-independent protein translocase protein TatA [Azospirillum sp. OGB3]